MSELESKSSALPILFFVVMIDMIGFGIIIPFLTYFIEDLASAEGILEIGLWVGLMLMSYSLAQFLFSPFWGSLWRQRAAKVDAEIGTFFLVPETKYKIKVFTKIRSIFFNYRFGSSLSALMCNTVIIEDAI